MNFGEAQAWWDAADQTGDVCQGVTLNEKTWMRAIAPCIPPAQEYPGVVLDLGCGPGRLTIPAAQARPDLIFAGVDISARMLDTARERREEAGVRRAVFMQCDGEHLPRAIRNLNGGWSVLLFQHLPDKVCADYLARIARKLRPGAKFLFQVVPDCALAPYSFPHSVDDCGRWLRMAGLEPVNVVEGLIHEQWLWMVGRKPSP